MANPKIQLRHDTKANWESKNPVLLEGEVAIETDTKRSKTGNGELPYIELQYNLQEQLDNKEDKLIPLTPITIVNQAAPSPLHGYTIQEGGVATSINNSICYPYLTSQNSSNQFLDNNSEITIDPETHLPSTPYVLIPFDINKKQIVMTPCTIDHLPSVAFGYFEGTKFIYVAFAGGRYNYAPKFGIINNVTSEQEIYTSTSGGSYIRDAVVEKVNAQAQSKTNPDILVEQSPYPNCNLYQFYITNTEVIFGSTINRYNTCPGWLQTYDTSVLNNFRPQLSKITHALYLYPKANQSIDIKTIGVYNTNDRMHWSTTFDNLSLLQGENLFSIDTEIFHNIQLNYDEETLGVTDGKLTVINGDPGGTINTQINGLQTQVMSKLDTDINNIDTTGKLAITDLVSHSATAIELSVSTSGTTYVAPANGIFTCFLPGGQDSGYEIKLMNVSYRYGANCRAISGQGGGYCALPIKKGDVLSITFYGPITGRIINFIHLNGSAPESEGT